MPEQKRIPTPKQKMNTILKKDSNLKEGSIPQFKDLTNMRTRQLALKFLTTRGDPELKQITLKDFAKK